MLAAGWLCEPTMPEVTERAYDFLNVCECGRTLFFHVGNL
jgi:hypothetical protein